MFPPSLSRAHSQIGNASSSSTNENLLAVYISPNAENVSISKLYKTPQGKQFIDVGAGLVI